MTGGWFMIGSVDPRWLPLRRPRRGFSPMVEVLRGEE